MSPYPPTNCKYCGHPGAHPGTQKCIGDGEACTLRCELKALRAKYEHVKDLLSRHCPYHYGEDSDDYPEVTHSKFESVVEGWTTVKCELTAEEAKALEDSDDDIA